MRRYRRRFKSPISERLFWRIIRATLFILLLSCIYTFLFVPRTSDELSLYPQWAITDLTTRSINAHDSHERMADFWYDDIYGSVDRHGNIIFSNEAPFFVVHSPKKYAIIDADKQSIKIGRSGSASILYEINDSGYPYIYDERVITLSATADTVMEWNGEHPVWSYHFAAPIADVAVTNSIVGVALLDGRFVIIDSTGMERATHAINAKYGIGIAIALSADEKRVVTIEGGEKFSFALYELDENKFVEINRFSLPPHRYALPYIRFIGGGYNALLAYHNRLYIFDSANNDLHEIEHNVDLLAIDESMNAVAVMSARAETTTISLYDHAGELLLSVPIKYPMPDRRPFIRIIDDMNLLIGARGHLVYLTASQS